MWRRGAPSLVMLALAASLTVPTGAQEMRPQIPCPILLVSGKVTGSNLQFAFMNKGKAPIQQLSVGCSPPQAGHPRDAICYTESGLFYPGQRYTIEFPYTGHTRGAVVLTARAARLGDGSRWMARAAGTCRPLHISRVK